jgi:NtrC-family two-component system response regulator AlgB
VLIGTFSTLFQHSYRARKHTWLGLRCWYTFRTSEVFTADPDDAAGSFEFSVRPGTEYSHMNILLIDDDANLRKSLRLALETMNHRITEASDGTRAEECLGHGMFDVAFLDLRLSAESGLDVLPRLLRLAPGLSVIVVTAFATIETAVEAMRRGAFDYLPKPFTPNEVRVVLDRVRRVRSLESHVEELEAQIKSIVPEIDLQTNEGNFQQSLEIAFRAASTEATILLRGESGTGKGVLARAIHAKSSRATGPFITVNCPSLSAELLESELFGHARGAFTGAVKDTLGKVAAAEGGTLFLDEIGDLPLVCSQNFSGFCKRSVTNAWEKPAPGPATFASWPPRIVTSAMAWRKGRFARTCSTG